jgi:hypothetical protein
MSRTFAFTAGSRTHFRSQISSANYLPVSSGHDFVPFRRHLARTTVGNLTSLPIRVRWHQQSGEHPH